MLSSFYGRSGAPDQVDSNALLLTPASSGRLKHAKSTSALQTISPLCQRATTLPFANGVARTSLLSPVPSPTSATHCAPSPTECSLPSPYFSTASASSPVPDSDESFARKIRYRLFSAAKKPAPPPVPKISHPFRNDDAKKLELDLRASAKQHARSFSNSTSGKASFGADLSRQVSAFELQKPSHQPNIDIKLQKYASGKTFFQDGLAKAHKQIFGRSKESKEDKSDTSDDEDEEHISLIYARVMVPLEFPSETTKEPNF